MSGYWSVVSTTTPAAMSAPASTAGGLVLRLRGLQASGATGAVTVTDSVSGIIWQVTLPASGVIALTDLDVRAVAPGNGLSVAATTGTGVSIQGDFVPIGYPYGLV